MIENLTRQQYNIARLVSIGLTNKQISEELGISKKGVNNHLWRLYMQLGIKRHKNGGEGCNQRVTLALMFLCTQGKLNSKHLDLQDQIVGRKVNT